jgi:Dyp-type peroxidase family
MKSVLRFDQIQGNITPGLRKSYQAFMLLQLPARGAAGPWLKALAPSVTSAREVREFLRRRRQYNVSDEQIATWQTKWVNVAFSWEGLAALGAPGLDEFPNDFREGMRRRAEAQLNDENIEHWEIGGTAEREAHVLLILAADTQSDLDAEIGRQQALAHAYGLKELRTYCGAELGGDLSGHEHFGYRDGISQPDKELPGAAPAWGEFVLGHANQAGERAPGPSWARNGSYAVFRRLRQDVAGFRNAVKTQASRIGRGLTPEQLGAKLVGRSTSGAKLTESGAGLQTPKWSGYDATRVTPSDFERDPDGERTPHFAHIRKSNPRDAEAQRHRLIRRGIPYGPALPPDTTDKQDRGLLFLAYQASVANQFEHVQRNWLNNAKFPNPHTGRDPLVGQPGGANELVLPLKGGAPASLTLGQFVTVTGGGYFFSPSIDALTQLANVATREDATMADDNSRLGEFILRQDPYNWKAAGLPGRPLPASLDSSPDVKMTGMGKHHDANTPFDFEYTPDQPQYWEGGLFWNLGDTTVRISKAVRIDYEYEDSSGNLVRKGLVIGFEGSGGGM